jgi:acyl-CoA synthetase (NDP forming)
MVPAGAELLVGVVNEPIFGPLVAVGLGGTATDLFTDRVHRLVPLTDSDADEMLTAFHAGARLFDPHRSPPLDRRAVVDTIIRIGRLADELPEVVELDLNPVVVGADGCSVVDARIRVAPIAPGDPTLRALGC